MPIRKEFTLTVMMVRVLAAIRDYWLEWGEAPSLDDLVEVVGKTKSTIHHYVVGLEKHGYLQKGRQKSKTSKGGWRVTPMTLDLLDGRAELLAVGRGKVH